MQQKWFDKDCSTLRRSLREMVRRVSHNQNDKEFLKHFCYQKKQYKQLLRKKERQYKGRTLQSFLDIEKINRNEFWKINENLKNNDKSISEKSEVISPNDWEMHFKKLSISNSVSNDVPDVINRLVQLRFDCRPRLKTEN